MEAKIGAAIAFCLKYVPDRVGGGGNYSVLVIKYLFYIVQIVDG